MIWRTCTAPRHRSGLPIAILAALITTVWAAPSVIAQTAVIEPAAAVDVALPRPIEIGDDVRRLKPLSFKDGAWSIVGLPGEPAFERQFARLKAAALRRDRAAIRVLAKVLTRYTADLGPKRRSFEQVLRAESLKGSSDAISAYADMFDRGIFGKPDPVNAARWYRWAAVRGRAQAQGEYARRLANGRGVVRNEASAVSWLARMPKDRAAAVIIDIVAERLNNDGVGAGAVRSIDDWMALALSYDKLAVAKHTKAFLLASRALAPPQRQAMLAAISRGLVGVTDPVVPRFLGDVYLSFEDRPSTLAAIAAYRLAAINGDAAAAEALRRGLVGALDDPELLAAYRSALGDAATAGNTDAKIALADCLTFGIGFDPSLARANALLTEAAEAGNAVAQFRLGVVISEGIGRPANPSDAVAWFLKAKASGQPLAPAFAAIAARAARAKARAPAKLPTAQVISPGQ